MFNEGVTILAPLLHSVTSPYIRYNYLRYITRYHINIGIKGKHTKSLKIEYNTRELETKKYQLRDLTDGGNDQYLIDQEKTTTQYIRTNAKQISDEQCDLAE